MLLFRTGYRNMEETGMTLRASIGGSIGANRERSTQILGRTERGKLYMAFLLCCGRNYFVYSVHIDEYIFGPLERSVLERSMHNGRGKP
jgi:hypothetical protein